MYNSYSFLCNQLAPLLPTNFGKEFSTNFGNPLIYNRFQICRGPVSSLKVSKDKQKVCGIMDTTKDRPKHDFKTETKFR